MEQKNNNPKFAFFYMLSLVALIFMAVSTGTVAFQIINKNIVDALDIYSGRYSSGALKFAISAIIISAPIYYLMIWQINKSLFKGALEKDSGIRKWLTYFILFVSSVVMIGWLIATVYNFLDGELTVKFILKALTAIIIAALIFSYYLYDIKREGAAGEKDKIVRIYLYGSIALVIAALISSFVFVESPTETRNIKHDLSVASKFSQIDSALYSYYQDNGNLPDSLDILMEETTYLRAEDIEDSITKKKFEYKKIDFRNYELCADFMISSKNYEDYSSEYYFDKKWDHDSGYQCLRQKVEINKLVPKQ